jgi:hypothetical protein
MCISKRRPFAAVLGVPVAVLVATALRLLDAHDPPMSAAASQDRLALYACMVRLMLFCILWKVEGRFVELNIFLCRIFSFFTLFFDLFCLFLIFRYHFHFFLFLCFSVGEKLLISTFQLISYIPIYQPVL